MDRLSYAALDGQGYEGFILKGAPERFLQFGEGNFLRAFVDYFIDVANEKTGFNSKAVVVQPIQSGLTNVLNEQDGLYTLYLRGMQNGEKTEEKRVISSISRALNPYEDYNAFLDCARNPDLRYIVSNTTEAGIVFDEASAFGQTPPSSFPAKLTRFMYERYKAFGNEKGRGFVILSCELIDHNGEELARCVNEYIRYWGIEDAFADWVQHENLFCSTLVDRIVTGYPKGEAQELNLKNGYEDKLLDTGEVFALWVIEAPESLEAELPFAKAGLPVKIVRDHTPYKQQKVRILNGAHTSMVPAAYLSGRDIVRDCMEDGVIRSFMENALYKEIIPTLSLPENELKSFAASVTERFQNPFIDHSLLAIALNCTSKWRARVLPSLKGYVDIFGKLPACLVFSFAAYIAFYRGVRLEENGLVAKRGDEEYLVCDDRFVLEFFFSHRGDDNKTLSGLVCANARFWGEDLGMIDGFTEAVERALDQIDEKGMYEALKNQLR